MERGKRHKRGIPELWRLRRLWRKGEPGLIDYLEIASRALERWQTRGNRDPNTPNAEPAGSLELQREGNSASIEPDGGRSERWLSWAEWKARELNRLFLEHGLMGQIGRITAETVRHGERQKDA
jgi:hypothetical protein